MKVLVDTSVWSPALRKQARSKDQERAINELAELIRESRVVMIGPIRQEVLSGISSVEVFEQLRLRLSTFDDEQLTTEHYELAASFSNECRRNGIQGSHTDFLLCAVSARNGYALFTLDKGFHQYKKHVGITLHRERA